ncbi:MAG: hypothetical protein KC912_24500, partial [Proteobacteria bacterium]|nr:hypothetical protein [Pseudomonadota bacterium]
MKALTALAVLIAPTASAYPLDDAQFDPRPRKVVSVDVGLTGAPDLCTSPSAGLRLAFDKERPAQTHLYWRPELGLHMYPCHVLSLTGGAEFGVRGQHASLALSTQLGAAYVHDVTQLTATTGMTQRANLLVGRVEFGPHLGWVLTPTVVDPIGGIDI